MTVKFNRNRAGYVRVLRSGYPVSHTAVFSPDDWEQVELFALAEAARRIREERGAMLTVDGQVPDEVDPLAGFHYVVDGARAFQQAADEAGFGRPQGG